MPENKYQLMIAESEIERSLQRMVERLIARQHEAFDGFCQRLVELGHASGQVNVLIGDITDYEYTCPVCKGVARMRAGFDRSMHFQMERSGPAVRHTCEEIQALTSERLPDKETSDG